jgi:TonB family protein
MPTALRKAACLLAGLAAFIAAPAASQEQPARAQGNLAELLSDEDYPAEALAKEEQGTVAFRLDVGRDGKPSRCTVLSSSGSASLDSTSCRIMMERARFDPARDASGKPVEDQVTSRITWKIESSELPPRFVASLELWQLCVTGEAAKLALSDLTPAEVVRRSFVPCAALEARFLQELKDPAPLTEMKGAVTQVLEARITEIRTRFAEYPAGR